MYVITGLCVGCVVEVRLKEQCIAHPCLPQLCWDLQLEKGITLALFQHYLNQVCPVREWVLHDVQTHQRPDRSSAYQKYTMYPRLVGVCL